MLSQLASSAQLQESDPDLFANLQAAEKRYEQAENRFEVVTDILDYILALQRWDVIEVWAQRAYNLDPEHWLSLYTLGFFYGACGRPDLAIPFFERLDHNYPENPVHLCLLIEACLANLEFERAKKLLQRALQEAGHPDRFAASDPTRFHYVRRLCILQGRLELAEGHWSGFATQLLSFKQQPMAHVLPNIPVWNGEMLHDKHICITRLGGFGDVLFFSALIKDIAHYAKRITVMVQPALHELLQASLPECTVLPYDTLSAEDSTKDRIAQYLQDTPPDIQASSVHLPLIAQHVLSKNELCFRPYLRVPQRAAQGLQTCMNSVRAKASGRPIIGIAWDRSQYHQPQIDGHQALLKKFSSLPLQELLYIIEHPNVRERFQFVALHEEETPRAWPNPMPHNFSRIHLQGESFAETAAAIAACDFIISIDMSIANISALMGKPTWAMLWHEGEWRFGHTGPTSTWLPNVRCHRQATPGDWRSVSNSVIDALTLLAATNRMPTVLGSARDRETSVRG